jgi:uncharacterized protein YcfL
MRFTLIIALVVALLTGCATVQVQQDVVVYGSNIRIDGVTESRTSDGVPEVVVFARSTAIGDRPARVRAIWFDRQGRPIDTVVSAWMARTLAGNRPFTLRMVGPSEQSARYRVEIEIL